MLVEPLAFLNLSNLSNEFCPASFGNGACGPFIFVVSAALNPAARPKTTKSIKELDPSLFAPWTETHAASPIAIRPGTTQSGFPLTFVRTSPW